MWGRVQALEGGVYNQQIQAAVGWLCKEIAGFVDGGVGDVEGRKQGREGEKSGLSCHAFSSARRHYPVVVSLSIGDMNKSNPVASDR